MINPEIWEDEHFGNLKDKEKILFIACMSNADDDGRLSGNPSNLRAIAFRFEEISTKEIEKMRDEVALKMKNFLLYEIDSCYYIQFKKWLQHQVIREDRKKDSKIPLCPHDDNQRLRNDGIDKVRLDKVSIDKNSKPSAVSCGKPVDNLEALKTVSKKIYVQFGLDTAKCVMSFKNKKKLREVPPYHIVFKTCEDMLSAKEIKEPWPWFIRVLGQNLSDYNAAGAVEDHGMHKTVDEVLRKAKDE